jgi:hypothetical protein
MLQAADLTHNEIAAHMDAYLRAGYRTHRMWTVCLPARNDRGEEWRECLLSEWYTVRAHHKAYDLRLMLEELAVMPPSRVLVLVGVRRK